MVYNGFLWFPQFLHWFPMVSDVSINVSYGFLILSLVSLGVWNGFRWFLHGFLKFPRGLQWFPVVS
jgi:hypothetical protein